MVTDKMKEAMDKARAELVLAKDAADAMRRAVWEAHMALDDAKATVLKKKAKVQSLEREAAKCRPTPPKDTTDYSRPVLLLISSKDMRRERLLGAFQSRAWAIHEARNQQALGRQADGCLFYVRDLRLKKGKDCDIVIRNKTPFMERYPGLARKAVLQSKGAHVT